MKGTASHRRARASSRSPDVRAVLFDLGGTLIFERIDDVRTLDRMKLHIRPHARDVIRRLSRRFKVGLVTDTETSSEGSVRSALKKLRLNSFFSVVVTSVDVGVTKPNPAIFRRALDRLDTDPRDAVMVGNDPDRDMRGGKRLGMTTILCRKSAYYRKGAVKSADYVIDSLDEIPQIMATLQRR